MIDSSRRRGERVARSGLRGFVRRYGWRSYALPILSVVTVVALVQPSAAHPHPGPARAAATTPRTGTTAAPPAAALVQIWSETDSTQCANNTQPQLVIVSISAQRIWVCEGPRQVNTSLVTTGAENVGDGTPLGSWVVQAKQTDRYLVGPGYRDYVKYWMPFDGDFGFHDASWQTMPYGSAGYRANGSHGCVHVPLATMSWLYNWATMSTVVTITA